MRTRVALRNTTRCETAAQRASQLVGAPGVTVVALVQPFACAQSIGTAWTDTSTCSPVGSSALPTKPPDTGSACSASLVTPTRIKVRSGDQTVGRIVFDPTCAGQIDAAPGVRAAAAPGRTRGVVVQVAGDETRGEAEAAHRFHHQHREVAAGAGTERQRLDGGLGAFLVACAVAESSLMACVIASSTFRVCLLSASDTTRRAQASTFRSGSGIWRSARRARSGIS